MCCSACDDVHGCGGMQKLCAPGSTPAAVSDTHGATGTGSSSSLRTILCSSTSTRQATHTGVVEDATTRCSSCERPSQRDRGTPSSRRCSTGSRWRTYTALDPGAFLNQPMRGLRASVGTMSPKISRERVCDDCPFRSKNKSMVRVLLCQRDSTSTSRASNSMSSCCRGEYELGSVPIPLRY